MRDKPLSEREVGAQLINETVAYAEAGVCRRKVLMSYFGEEYEQGNCGHCDNCKHPKEKIEAKENLFFLLEQRAEREFQTKPFAGYSIASPRLRALTRVLAHGEP